MFKTFVAALFSAVVSAKDGKDFKGDEYIALSRQEKSDKIWGKITENDKSGHWHPTQTLVVGQNEVFDTEGDEFDCNMLGCRNKTIHSKGNVGQIEWVNLGDHPYTGIFKGGDSGYVRFSVAAPVDIITPKLLPGMGVKFLRDGVDSANFVAMFSVDGQKSLNFFENDWSNHIPTPQTKALIPLLLRFKTGSDYIQTVGLSEMASFTQEGVYEGPVFPFSLRFEPSGDWEFPEKTYLKSFEKYLQTIPEGALLYNIYAMDKPAELGGTEKKIGQMKTKTKLVTSRWGDDHMYFRHQRMDDDLKLHPEWEEYTPNPKILFNNRKHEEKLVKAIDYACPFLNFFQ